MTNKDEHSLVTRSQAGDAEAFGALYEYHVDWVYGYIISRVGDRDIASDLTQTVFLKAFESLRRFQPNSSFGAWLNGITKHVVVDHFRHEARYKRLV